MTNPTEVNEGVALITVGRTAPIPAGPQTSALSLPVVVATDQAPIPVEEVNKTVSEVSLSLLGIPRTETALGIFSDVTTYDVNPNEWQALIRASAGASDVALTSTGAGTALQHSPQESAGIITSSAAANSSTFAILTSQRFFRYQPGRASSGTFGVSMTVSTSQNDIKKWGCFDRFDGYYFEVQGGSQIDKSQNFFAVRRSSAFSATISPLSGETGTAGSSLIITRDGLQYVHAGLYDQSLRVASGGTTISGLGISFQVASTAPMDYRYVYEYRVPRQYFSKDRMDGSTNQTAYYSDVVPGGVPFTFTLSGTADAPIVSYTSGTIVPDTLLDSVWDLDFTRVTMFKIEYGWYGAIGAKFLAYVPVIGTPGQVRWVEMTAIRVSNQSRLPSLGNPFLPISYYTSRGAASASSVRKYGASYYIDGGDKGTIVIRSATNTADQTTSGTGTVNAMVLQVRSAINGVRNRQQVYPLRLGIGANERVAVSLIKNPTIASGSLTLTNAATLSPVSLQLAPTATFTGGTTIMTFYSGVGGADIDLSPYFAFNKEYLSYPLAAAQGDTFLVAFRRAGATNVSASCSLAWEEQS